MKFNKNQKNGLATVFDNIGTAVIIGLIIGTFIDSKITLFPAIALSVTGSLAIGIALLLRRKR